MSNQFPPAGYGQGEGYQQPGQQPNGDSYGAPQANSGYQSSTGDYQGYQPQQQGYGSYGQDQGTAPQGDYASYGSYGQDPNAYGQQNASNAYGDQNASNAYGEQNSSNAYGQQSAAYGQEQQVYGQQDYSQPESQAAYGSYGQDANAGYGGYGQPGYDQNAYGQPGADQNAAAYGGYGQQGYAPQGQPKKKGPAGWVWAVVAVLGLALIGGLVWGGIALFGGGGGGIGGGPDYSIESKETVNDAEVTYNGSWKEASFGGGPVTMYEDSSGDCQYGAAFSSELGGKIDPEDVRGSMRSAIDDAIGASGGQVSINELESVKKKDTEGIEVEFLLYEVTASSMYGGGSVYVAMHPFSDSGDAIAAMMMCTSGGDEEMFKEQFDATEFTLDRGE